MYPQGGYKAVTPIQIANALAALDRGAITVRGLRVYLGCFALLAAREAAARVAKPGRPPAAGRVRFGPDELVRLLGDADTASVRRELRRLERAKLVVFRPESVAVTQTPLDHSGALLGELCAGRKATRPVPVPRRLLVFLCRCRKPALVKTLLAYLVRGLAIDRRSGEVRGAGTVKATWIARVFGLSERAARAARAELIRLGVISKDTGSHQRKLNRDGAYFRIDLAWGPSCDTSADHGHSSDTVAGATSSSPSACPQAELRAESAPPGKRPETPSDLKDRKLAAHDGAGVCRGRGEVSLRDIRPGDIRRVSSLRQLYAQAAAAGWLQRSEAGFLAFAAAAVRANRAHGDPVRIFVAIVRRGLWHHITHADEDRARRVIARTREGERGGDSFVRDLVRRLAA